ncbi:(2Fe-2S) ferredoxin domain-containing protein [Methylomarinum vadi]|uniref:(2Fe-2S) ferredoxin domain-containing protein n=1 Tax=Methylomarinum vadi TaxID=438855 RepID=UPI0004DECC65|nr:NAD(P)H-dependent oxidoreductase subunit E [Methylomarinum vadi]
MTEMMKPKMRDYKRQVLVCVGTKCCEHNEGQALYEQLKIKLKQSGLDIGELRVIRSRVGCLGTCQAGPLLCVQPDGVWYYGIDEHKLDKIIEQHLIAGKPVEEWVYHQGPVK